VKKLVAYISRVDIPSSSTLKMEAAGSSEMLAYHTIIPQSVTSHKAVIIIDTAVRT
jgi:hypothetical protein